MKKIKFILAVVAIASLSSCGIFNKNCHCPHFSKVKPVKPGDTVPRYS